MHAHLRSSARAALNGRRRFFAASTSCQAQWNREARARATGLELAPATATPGDEAPWAGPAPQRPGGEPRRAGAEAVVEKKPPSRRERRALEREMRYRQKVSERRAAKEAAKEAAREAAKEAAAGRARAPPARPPPPPPPVRAHGGSEGTQPKDGRWRGSAHAKSRPADDAWAQTPPPSRENGNPTGKRPNDVRSHSSAPAKSSTAGDARSSPRPRAGAEQGGARAASSGISNGRDPWEGSGPHDHLQKRSATPLPPSSPTPEPRAVGSSARDRPPRRPAASAPSPRAPSPLEQPQPPRVHRTGAAHKPTPWARLTSALPAPAPPAAAAPAPQPQPTDAEPRSRRADFRKSKLRIMQASENGAVGQFVMHLGPYLGAMSPERMAMVAKFRRYRRLRRGPAPDTLERLLAQATAHTAACVALRAVALEVLIAAAAAAAAAPATRLSGAPQLPPPALLPNPLRKWWMRQARTGGGDGALMVHAGGPCRSWVRPYQLASAGAQQRLWVLGLELERVKVEAGLWRCLAMIRGLMHQYEALMGRVRAKTGRGARAVEWPNRTNERPARVGREKALFRVTQAV